MSYDPFLHLEPVYDTMECMREHGIFVPRVFTKLRRFGMERDNVKRIVLGSYSGKSYSIALLLEELTIEKMREVVSGLNEIVDEFNGKRVLMYPLGPSQSESYLFYTEGFYIIYPDEGKI